MSDEDNPKNSSLVPSGNRDLTIRSSALVRRGLESLISQQARIVRFPLDRSMGKLRIITPGALLWEGEEIEACGNVTVPGGKDLSLLVSARASTDLSPLASLKPDDLQEINLSANHISDSGLVYLRGLTSLRVLSLEFAQITDVALAHVQALNGLEELYLSHTQVTDAGLIYIRALINLQYLSLQETQVTDDGLSHLRALSKLKMLWLNDTRIRGEGLTYVGELTYLQFLDLNNTQINDSGLVHIRRLTGLRELILPSTGVTNTGVGDLRRALPNCLIRR